MKIGKKGREIHVPYATIAIVTYILCVLVGIGLCKFFCWFFMWDYTIGAGLGFGSLVALIITLMLPKDNEK